jgi:hypothetical protein
MRACPSLAYRPTCACACASSPGKKLVPRVSHVFCGRRVVYGCKMGDRRRSSRTNSIFILEHAGVGGGITGAWYAHAQGRHDRRNGFPLALLGSRLNSTYVGLSADTRDLQEQTWQFTWRCWIQTHYCSFGVTQTVAVAALTRRPCISVLFIFPYFSFPSFSCIF